jgi:hypothetical protein
LEIAGATIQMLLTGVYGDFKNTDSNSGILKLR